MQEIILKIRYFERGSSKSIKKVNFIFSFELSPFSVSVTLEKSGKFHVFSFFLEKSGNVCKHLNLGWFGIFFSGKVWKMHCLKVKNFNFKKKLFPQLSTCCFTYYLDLYSLFLSFNDNWTSKTTEFSVVLQT